MSPTARESLILGVMSPRTAELWVRGTGSQAPLPVTLTKRQVHGPEGEGLQGAGFAKLAVSHLGEF